MWEQQGAINILQNKNKVYDKDKLDLNLSLQEHFGFDFSMIYLDNSLRQPTKLIKSEKGMITVKDRCGYTADKFIGKSRTMHMYNHITTSKDSWDKHKSRLSVDIDDLSRVNKQSYFMRYDKDQTWEQSISEINQLYNNNNYVFINSYGPFEAAWRHRGFTQLLMDSALDEKFIEEIFSAHTDLIIETLKKALSMGMKIDGYFLVEDLGHTRGLLISPAVYKRTLHKQHRKLGDYLHSQNIDFFMHSCGMVKELIPLFIDEGLDVLQAIESKANQDVAKLSKEYGKDICFMGNIDVQELAKGKDAIKAEIYRKIIPAMKNGGYIYHSDHSIPPEVALEDYIYMMDLIKKL
ncbi:MAG: hypothetical protein KAG94_06100 [Clostridiales bacterium]|nr:hypothetical protein [Clostridiales bacterium]